jgi:hypothetical protein
LNLLDLRSQILCSFHYGVQVGHELMCLRNPLTSASKKMGLQLRTTILGYQMLCFIKQPMKKFTQQTTEASYQQEYKSS